LFSFSSTKTITFTVKNFLSKFSHAIASQHKQIENKKLPQNIQGNPKSNTRKNSRKYLLIFFHPDYTVGFGI